MLSYKFLPTTFATYLNEIFYLIQRFGIFFLFEKENACKRKANAGLRSETPTNAAPQYIACSCSVGSSAHSPANALALERVRARAACKASRPALSKHSRLSPLERALCSLFFANIAPRFIRHRRRFGDVARRTSDSPFKHCGEAIGGLFLGVYKVVCFTFVKLCGI